MAMYSGGIMKIETTQDNYRFVRFSNNACVVEYTPVGPYKYTITTMQTPNAKLGTVAGYVNPCHLDEVREAMDLLDQKIVEIPDEPHWTKKRVVYDRKKRTVTVAVLGPEDQTINTIQFSENQFKQLVESYA
jgi:hypothetical protein